jgi:hypothetical protein
MSSKKFLHLYLKECPDEAEIKTILDFYGFRLVKSDKNTDNKDPQGFHWEWLHKPLSETGFKMVFYHGVFPDDSHSDRYGSFVMLIGNKHSSVIDTAFMDVITKFLLDRYDGIIHNPSNLNSSIYLCGKPRGE